MTVFAVEGGTVDPTTHNPGTLLYVRTDTGQVWYWNDSAWVKIVG